jgi:hypothetical protein
VTRQSRGCCPSKAAGVRRLTPAAFEGQQPRQIGDVVHEAAQEFVQPLVEDRIGGHGGQILAHAPGKGLGPGRAGVALGQAVEMGDHARGAGDQRARALPVEDQEIGDLARRDLAAIGPAKGAQHRQRAQQGDPLVIVIAGADQIKLWQQHIVLHIHQPRGVVGAFQIVAQMQEIPAVIA